jgi:hypothetical protein
VKEKQAVRSDDIPGTVQIAGGLGPLGGLLPPVTVRAEDIPATVQIIGKLGQPIGSLLRIRGKWITINSKGDSLHFEVALVNGKKLDEKVVIVGELLGPMYPQKGRGPKPGELWDWRVDLEGNEPWPTRSEGET